MAYFSSVPSFLFMFSMFLLISCSQCKEYLVGGSEGSWKVPLPSDQFLDQWAKSHRFKIGDSLVWKYDQRSESVLQVLENDFANCNKSKPIEYYDDSDTKVVLKHSGPYYFISGAEGHCEKGLKLKVVVMSKTHGGRSDSPVPAPAPAPASPALSPSIGGVARSSCGGFMGIIIGFSVSLVMMVTV